MFVKVLVIFAMLIGLAFTIVPRVPGTVVILISIAAYGLINDFKNFTPLLWVLLLLLMVLAEFGGRLLRLSLTKKYDLTRQFSSNSIAANLGGIMVFEALLGPIIGLIIWELITGRTMESKLKTITAISLRLVFTAMFRFLCGLAMLVLALLYLL